MNDHQAGEPRTYRVLLPALIVVTLILFWRVSGFPKLEHPDDDGILHHRHVSRGITAEGIRWALGAESAKELSYWQPVTVLFNMASITLAGLDAGRHHLIGVVLHTLNACVLFGFFRRATGREWTSFWIALLFAIHPLQVEAVAWIPSRTDLLSGFFLLLSIGAHGKYASAPSRRRHLQVTGLGALAMLSKPSAVTLPMLLLLLDGWPLNRFPRASEESGEGRTDRWSWRIGVLVLEKWPLFTLAAIFSVATLATRNASGFFGTSASYPVWIRLATVPWNYILSLWKFLFPFRLEVFPMNPWGTLPGWKALLAAVVLAVSTAAAALGRKRFPAVAVGWFWFLVTLLPVSGIVQILDDGVADRHLYLPLVGMAMIAVWGGRELAARSRVPANGRTAVAGAVAAFFSAISWGQVGYWSSTETVLKRSIEVSPANFITRNGLGQYLARHGRPEEATVQFRESLRLHSSPSQAWVKVALGRTLIATGRPAEAVRYLEEACSEYPDRAEAVQLLAAACYLGGRYPQAREAASRLLDRGDRDPVLRELVGLSFTAEGKFEEAIPHFEEALRAAGDRPDFIKNLAIALASAGRFGEAERRYREILGIYPQDGRIRLGLAEFLLGARKVDAAKSELEEILRQDPDNERANSFLKTIRHAGTGK